MFARELRIFPQNARLGAGTLPEQPAPMLARSSVFIIFPDFRRPEVMEERFSPVCRFYMSHFYYF